jgi:RNA polymerase sigma-70 factor (ECF subfamily)
MPSFPTPRDSSPEGTPSRLDADAALIAAVAAGDADAFEELVRKYERPVLSTIYRYVGDRAAAEDVAQEIFLKVWRRAGSFKGRSSFSTWLYRIAVNQCLNFREKRRRRRGEPLDERMADMRPGPAERYEAEARSRLVREAMDGLPGKQRMALILSKYERRSYKEIAQIMGVSLAAVESLIFRGKQNLKQVLLPLRERGEL